MSGARLLGAVLAGGESRRFGRDKAVEVIAGMTLAARAAETLSEVCGAVVIVSSRPKGLSSWDVVADVRTGQGPLAGIETALVHARGLGLDGAFVLACDLPLVDTTTIRELVAAAAHAPACAPHREAPPGVEPLCAVYRLSCLPAVSGALDRGERAVHRAFFAAGGTTTRVAGDVFLNVNRPADVALVESLLKTRGGLDAAAAAGTEGLPSG